jgi:glutaryl-CoA dehydrogenase
VTKKIERKMALRAVQNADITMDKVFVKDSDRFQLADDFATGTKEVLMHSRLFVAWLATGMAAGACEAAFKYCTERKQFKKPLAQHQLVQAKLVKAVALVSQSITLCMHITRMYVAGLEAGNPIPIGRIAMVKAECTRNCREVA